MNRQNVKRGFVATALVTALVAAAGPAHTAERVRQDVAPAAAPQAQEGWAAFWDRLLAFVGVSLDGATRIKRGAGIDPNGFELEEAPYDPSQLTLTRRGAGIDPNG